MGELHLVRGSDPALVAAALRTLLDRLVGDADRTLVLEDHSPDPETGITPALAAARTPPFLTDRRIVVLRDVQVLKGRRGSAADDDASGPGIAGEQLADLCAYLAAPTDSTDLVCVAISESALPKALLDALKQAGGTIHDTDPGTGKAAAAWFAEQLAAAPVRLDDAAASLVRTTLGEDVGRLDALLDLLAATYGPGVRLHAEEVRPYLASAGGIPPWELTDPLDAGDPAAALAALDRLLVGGQRHPLQVLATLQGHYTRMLRLDGAGVSSEAEAAALLGMRGSTFPAKKAMTTLRRLGGAEVRRAVRLLADADADLKGRSGVAPAVVLQLLVARLARLGGRRGAPTRR
jgi:DNA polymerase-3 subunit delta